jgi:hypothetical protein
MGKGQHLEPRPALNDRADEDILVTGDFHRYPTLLKKGEPEDEGGENKDCRGAAGQAAEEDGEGNKEKGQQKKREERRRKDTLEIDPDGKGDDARYEHNVGISARCRPRFGRGNLLRRA